MWESVSDSQLRSFVMKELEEFNERPDTLGKKKRAAMIVGRQRDSEVYVLNENVQVFITYYILYFSLVFFYN